MSRLAVPKTYKLYIGGAFPRSESGRTYEVLQADGAFLANAAKASRKDARDAVVAARGAVAGWGGATAYNRGQVLYRIAELLEGRRAQFVAEIEEAEGVSRAVAAAQVDESIDRWVWYAGWADKYAQVAGNANPVAGPYFNISVPEPTGVVAIVAPQDSSLLGFVSAVAPALVAGNSVVVGRQRAVPAVGHQPRRGARDERRAEGRRQRAHRLAGRDRAVAREPRRRQRDRPRGRGRPRLDLARDRRGRHAEARAPARVGSRRRGAGARPHQRVHRDQDGLAHQEPEVAVGGRGGASDERGRLVADPFDYRVTKHGGVIVSRGGRVVMTVGGTDAGRLVVALQRADDSQAQHLLARASGNYRRGNERA